MPRTERAAAASTRTMDSVKRYARSKTKRALEVLNACMEDESAQWNVRVAAANAILDRALGKPKTTADVNVSGEVSVQQQHLVAIREAADLRLRTIDAEAEADDAKERLRPAVEAKTRPAIQNPSRDRAREEANQAVW